MKRPTKSINYVSKFIGEIYGLGRLLSYIKYLEGVLNERVDRKE